MRHPPDDLDALVADQWDRLVRALTVYVADGEVAREIVQEAFVRAADRWSRVARMDAPGAWVQRVAVNLATDHLRRRGREQAAVARLGAGALGASPAPDVAGRTDLAAALALLGREERAVVVLRYVVGLTSAEVGERLGRPAPTVRAMARRALTRMREHVDVAVPTDAEESLDAH